MRAMQKLDEAREKLEETNKEFDSARRKAKQAKVAFERAKQERHDLFMKCFDHVSNIIDDIYKALCRNQSAQAFLGKFLQNIHFMYTGAKNIRTIQLWNFAYKRLLNKPYENEVILRGQNVY